jgi:hypothetical protein
MGATCGAGTDHPSEAYCVHPRVLNSGVRGARSIVFCAMFCRKFFVLFLLAIVLSVLRFMASYYHFGIIKYFLSCVFISGGKILE